MREREGKRNLRRIVWYLEEGVLIEAHLKAFRNFHHSSVVGLRASTAGGWILSVIGK